MESAASERRFVGRRVERARIAAACAAAQMGRRQLVLIGGEPGIGKTRLAEIASEEARASGARVIWSRCWDWGGAPSYWPLLQVVRELCTQLDDTALAVAAGPWTRSIARLVPEVARRLPIASAREQGDDPQRARFELFAAVEGFLRACSEAAPIVVVLDDLHGADVPSLELLRFVARERSPAKLLLLATHRTVDAALSPDAARCLAELAREGESIALRGLDDPALAELLEGGPLADRAADVAAATAGNPLYVDGLVRGLPLGELAIGSVLAADVRATIAGRIERLDAGVRGVVEVAAVIARPCTASLLARVLDAPLGAALTDLDVATRAGLLVETSGLGTWTFFHPLVREVAYSDLAPARRMDLHARAATALRRLYGEGDGAHLAELARHLSVAAPLGLQREAFAALFAAGARARSLFAFEEAAGLFSQALASLDGTEPDHTAGDRSRGLEALGEARLWSGDPLGAREAFEALGELARARPDPVGFAGAVLGVARTFEFGVAEPRRLALLEEALMMLAPDDSPSLARVLARLAMELWMVTGAEARREALADRAVAMAERLDDPGLLAASINAWLQCVWGPEHLVRRRERADELRRVADRSGSLERRLEAERWRINVLTEAGEMAAAEGAIASYAQLADELRIPMYVANALMRRALLPQLRDEPGADALARDTWEAMRGAGDPQADVVYDSRSLLRAVERKDREAIERLLPALRTHVAARPRFLLYRAVLLQGLIAADARDEAAAQWELIWREELRDLGRDPMRIANLALLATACAALGDRPRAERLAELLAPFRRFHAAIGASYSLGAAAHHLGLCADLLGRSDEAEALFRDAQAFNERMGARGFAARSAEALARITRAAAPTASTSPGSTAALLHEEGAVWLVEHAGQHAHVRASRGLRYLRTLLERPGQDVHVLDLVTRERGEPEGDVDPAAGAGPALDARAKAAYRARVEDLREAIAEAESFGDPDRAARARAELEAISEELASALGLGGRDRPTGTTAERARISVAKAITRAIASLAEVAPGLGEHLRRAVRTGAFCRYDPEPGAGPSWRF